MIQFTKWSGLCSKMNYSLEKISFSQILLNADLLSAATTLFNLTKMEWVQKWKDTRTSNRNSQIPSKIHMDKLKQH